VYNINERTWKLETKFALRSDGRDGSRGDWNNKVNW
jgi:hypothetical protein